MSYCIYDSRGFVDRPATNTGLAAASEYVKGNSNDSLKELFEQGWI